MNHDERSAAVLKGHRNPGRILLDLEQAGLVVVDQGDTVRLAIVSAERDDYAHALQQAVEGDWTLAKHLMRADPYRRIMSRYDKSREAEWVAQAKRVKGAA